MTIYLLANSYLLFSFPLRIKRRPETDYCHISSSCVPQSIVTMIQREQIELCTYVDVMLVVLSGMLL